MARKNESEDDDEDDDDDTPEQKKDRGRGGKQRRHGKKGAKGDVNTAAAGAAAAIGAVVGSGDSLIKDIGQAGSPVLARRFADFVAGLVPEDGIRWIRDEIGTGRNVRDVCTTFVLTVFDQLNLIPEGSNKPFNDFAADLAGAIGRRVDGEDADGSRERTRAEARAELGRINKTRFVWLPDGVLSSDNPVMHADDCLALPLSIVERRKRYHRVGIVRARLLIKGAERTVERRSCCAETLNSDFAEVEAQEKKLMSQDPAASGPQKRTALELLATPKGIEVVNFVTKMYSDDDESMHGRKQVMAFLYAHLDFDYEPDALHSALERAEAVAVARGLDANARNAEARELFETVLEGIQNAKSTQEEVVDAGKKALEALKERANLKSELAAGEAWIKKAGAAVDAGFLPLRTTLLAPPPPPKPMKKRGLFERICVKLGFLSDDTKPAAATATPNNQQGGQQPPGGTP